MAIGSSLRPLIGRGGRLAGISGTAGRIGEVVDQVSRGGVIEDEGGGQRTTDGSASRSRKATAMSESKPRARKCGRSRPRKGALQGLCGEGAHQSGQFGPGHSRGRRPGSGIRSHLRRRARGRSRGLGSTFISSTGLGLHQIPDGVLVELAGRIARDALDHHHPHRKLVCGKLFRAVIAQFPERQRSTWLQGEHRNRSLTPASWGAPTTATSATSGQVVRAASTSAG